MGHYAREFFGRDDGLGPQYCYWRDVVVDTGTPGGAIAALNHLDNYIELLPNGVYTLTMFAKSGAAPTGTTLRFRRTVSSHGLAFSQSLTNLAGSVVYPSFDTIDSDGAPDGWDWTHVRPEMTVEGTAGEGTVDILMIQSPGRGQNFPYYRGSR